MTKLIFLSILLLNCYAVINSIPVQLSEGDMVIDNRRSLGIKDGKWKDNVIPYVISNAYSNENKELIKSAMRLLESKTSQCIRFVEKDNSHTNYINIFIGGGCYSYVGQIGGKQDVSLGNGCMYKGTIVHELMHALGFKHEQNRPDRDNYIDIIWGNIQTDMRHNFKKYPEGVVYNTPYDFDSVMQYTFTAFGNGKQTMRPKDENVKVIHSGLRTDDKIMSLYDIQAVRARYGCSNTAYTTKTNQVTTGKPETIKTTKAPTVSNYAFDFHNDHEYKTFNIYDRQRNKIAEIGRNQQISLKAFNGYKWGVRDNWTGKFVTMKVGTGSFKNSNVVKASELF